MRAVMLAERTIANFGDEWTWFDQTDLADADVHAVFDGYFRLVDWARLGEEPLCLDAGCGSGRWARLVAPRVGRLEALDASPRVAAVAQRRLSGTRNASVVCASVTASPFRDGSFDFVYSLGVLHHVPDTDGALRRVSRLLKPGGQLLLYLYYRFDNRPWWYRLLWRATEVGRFLVSRAPRPVRYAASQLIAGVVYWPLARSARLLGRLGLLPSWWPLSFYRDRTFYVMRTDALDRFGTRLEQRFTRAEIERMLEAAGMEDIVFSETPPYWVCVSRRAGEGRP